MDFSFSAIEHSLARHFRVREDARTAFYARIKHLQRNGFPPGVNTGRGHAAAYGADHLLMISIALELASLGLNPERAGESVARGWKFISTDIQHVIESAEDGSGSSMIAVTYYDGLADLVEDPMKEKFGILFSAKRSRITEALNRPSMRDRRFGLFNLTNAVIHPLNYLAEAAAIDPASMRAEAIRRLVDKGPTSG